jgi:alkanesulfonate monooxygenase SsuD/methylene tetrahydromethanopterin reductase-like flavin-dependent oxidoreductase (luciferase family)
MEEAVGLILALWTERRTTFHRRYFHAEDAIFQPNPVQKPRPPVMIAGRGVIVGDDVFADEATIASKGWLDPTAS